MGNTRRMLVVGHRGASRAAPENTPTAFELAAAMGADAVELDVRLAADGRLVVKHDPLMPGESHGDIADLDDVLSACGEMLVNVEIKNSPDEFGYDATHAVVRPTIEAIRRHGADERFIVSSFDWDTLQAVKSAAPTVPTGFLVADTVTATIVERTAAAGHDALHPWDPTVDADVVARCHAAGLALTTWTCNDPARIAELAEIGVDGVCTDVPDVALTALGRRLAPSRPRWGR